TGFGGVGIVLDPDLGTRIANTTDGITTGTYAVNFEVTLASLTTVNLSMSMIKTDGPGAYEVFTANATPDAFVAGQTTFDRVGLRITGSGVAPFESPIQFSNVAVSVVPEPNSIILLCLGITGLGALARGGEP